MKTILLLSLAFLCTPLAARADTAVDVVALPAEETEKALRVYEVALTVSQRNMVLDFIRNAPGKKTSEIESFKEDLADEKSDVLLSGFFSLGYDGGSAAIFSRFKDHKDPLLRFIASLVLAGGGDSEAAKVAFKLIHSTEPTKLQKQILKNYCAGVGIHTETDTADTIYDYLTTAASKVPKLKAGDTAPNFDVKDIDGKKIELKAFKGRIVLLHFWATTCGPCMEMMGRLADEMKSYPADKVVVISISLDEDRDAFVAAVKRFGTPWTSICDGGGWGGEIARAYGVNRMPFDVIVDQRGIVKSNDTKDIPQILSNAIH